MRSTMAEPKRLTRCSSYSRGSTSGDTSKLSMLDEAIEGADLVIVHEWNSPELIAQIGRRRSQGARFTLLFHDTHHRAVSAPEELARFDLGGFDGVLAFGEVLRQIYLRLGWARPCLHLARGGDTALYRPAAACRTDPRSGLDRQLGRRRTRRRAERVPGSSRSPSSACAPGIHGVRYSEAGAAGNRGGGHRISRLASGPPCVRRRLPRHAPPSTCRAVPTPSRCRASRPSGCSRRWHAAFRSFRRRGMTASTCFRRGAICGPATASR